MQQQCWHAGHKVGQVEPQQHLGLLEGRADLVQQRGYGRPWHLVAHLSCVSAGRQQGGMDGVLLCV